MEQILYSIVFSALFIYVSSIAFSFFNIGFDVYGNYLLWIVALVIFGQYYHLNLLERYLVNYNFKINYY